MFVHLIFWRFQLKEEQWIIHANLFSLFFNFVYKNRRSKEVGPNMSWT